MKRLAAVTLAALFSAPFVYAESEKSPDGAWAHAPLIQVMHDLAFHFSRIEFGIFTNNRHMIIEGANALASHPFPEEGVKPYLRKKGEGAEQLTSETIGVIKKTAAELAGSAGMATMLELQQKANVIAEVCVGCHDLYRD